MANNQPDVRIRLSAEGVEEVMHALRQVQAQATKSAQQATDVGENMSAAAQGVAALKGAVGALAAAAAGLVALDKIQELAAAGIAGNQLAERASASVAAVIASQADIEDGNGRLLKGQEAYSAAVKLSADYMGKLAEDAAGTGLDFDAISKASSQIVFTGINAGIKDLDELRTLTISAAKTLQTFSGTIDNVGQEVEKLLKGDKGKLSEALNISPATLQAWKKQGILSKEVSKRLAENAAAAKAYRGTLEGLKSQWREAVSQLTGSATVSLFDKVKEGYSKALDGLFEKAGVLRPEVQAVVDLLDRVGGAVGTALTSSVQTLVSGLRLTGTWLQENSTTVNQIALGFADVASFVGKALVGMAGFVNQTSLLVRTAGAVSLIFNTIAGYVNLTQQGIAKLLSLTATNDAQRAYFENEAALARKRSELNLRDAKSGLNTAMTGRSPKPTKAADSDERDKLDRIKKKKNKDANAQGEADDAKSLADAWLAVKVALAEQEAKLEDAKAKLNAAKNKAEYDAGKLALIEYHKARLAEIQAAADRETAVLNEKLAKAEALPNVKASEKVAREKAINEANSAISLRSQQLALDLFNEQAKQQDELNSLTRDAVKLTAQYDELMGQRGATALAALNEEIKAQEKLLAQQGASAEKIKEITDAMRKRGEAQIKFDSSGIDKAGDSADLAKRQVEADKASGKLWEFEAAQKIADIEKKRLADLEAAAVALNEIAHGPGGTDEMKKKAADINMAVYELRASTDEYGKVMEQLKDTIEGSLSGGINEMLDQIVEGTASGKDAVKGFVRSMADSFRKKAQALLVDEIVKPILGLFSSASSPQKAADVQRQAANTQQASTGKFEKAVEAFEKAVDKLQQKTGVASELDAFLEKAKGANVSKGVDLASVAQDLPTFPSGEQLSNYFSKTADANNDGPFGARSAAPWAQSAATIGSAATSISTGAATLTEGAGMFTSSVSMFESAAGLISTAGSLMQASSTASSAGASASGIMSLFSGSGFATGGLIRGPGSATSDSIQARLSNGEYVLKASAVKSLGVSTLDMLNATGSLQPLLANSYAAQSIPTVDGGVAGSIQQAAGGGTSRIELGLEPGLFAKHIKSPEGQKAVVEVLATRRRSVKKATG